MAHNYTRKAKLHSFILLSFMKIIYYTLLTKVSILPQDQKNLFPILEVVLATIALCEYAKGVYVLFFQKLQKMRKLIKLLQY
jgi:hypothetical protein